MTRLIQVRQGNEVAWGTSDVEVRDAEFSWIAESILRHLIFSLIQRDQYKERWPNGERRKAHRLHSAQEVLMRDLNPEPGVMLSSLKTDWPCRANGCLG